MNLLLIWLLLGVVFYIVLHVIRYFQGIRYNKYPISSHLKGLLGCLLLGPLVLVFAWWLEKDSKSGC